MDDIDIHKIMAGDPVAFRQWVAAYQSMAFSIALSIVKDQQEAEEVVQDSFVKAYQGLGKFRKDAQMRTWFFRILTNEALGHLRRKRNLPQLTLLDPEMGERDFGQPMTGSDQEFELQQEGLFDKQLILQALSALPARESLALRIFYLEEESLKTLCAITGWSVVNAKVILHRARKHMFERLSILKKTKVP